MPSERRLHAASILFGLGAQIREFAFPVVIALVAGSRGDNLEAMMLPFLLVYAGLAFGRYYAFRYSFGADELVVRSGLVFRKIRHVPYARIQNLDARQNPLHRALGVVDVRVDTGSGGDVDARLSVVAWAAYLEMRERVFGALAGRAASAGSEAAGIEAAGIEAGRSGARTAAIAPAPEPLLTLSARELAVHGLIEARGGIVIAGLLGLVWESGLGERLTERYLGHDSEGWSFLRGFLASTDSVVPWDRVVIGLGAIAAFLMVARILSVAVSLVRLHGFRLVRAGEDLRAQYGLFTRISSTIPLRRVQTVTVTEGWLHRRFGRVTVRVDTAGGGGGGGGEQGSATRRESLAPILERARWPALAAIVLPGVDVERVEWQPPAPGTLLREIRQRLILAAGLALTTTYLLGWGMLVVFAVLGAWSIMTARWYVAHLGWAATTEAVFFRSGWWSRHVTVAPVAKIQSVAWHESPFDRRWRTARLNVDTAGANALSHRVHIPYLPRQAAADLRLALSAAASRTAFRW
jgi:putative membrane protein